MGRERENHRGEPTLAVSQQLCRVRVQLGEKSCWQSVEQGQGAAAPCEAPVKCPALVQLPGASWATGSTSDLQQGTNPARCEL